VVTDQHLHIGSLGCVVAWPCAYMDGRQNSGKGRTRPAANAIAAMARARHWTSASAAGRAAHTPRKNCKCQMSLFSSRTAQPPPSGRHTSSPPQSMAGGPVAARMMNGARAIYLCLSALYAIVRGFSSNASHRGLSG
jgi:hypothetical protein